MDDVTFADYFVVCGLDASSGLELERYSEAIQDSSEAVPPLERSYAAKVLSHFPQSRPDRPFPSEILALCMPRGLEFATQKEVAAGAAFHSVALMRADGRRVNGAVLTFFERVGEERIRDEMAALHAAHVREITAAAEGETRQLLVQDAYHPPGQTTGGSHTLPRRRAGSNALRQKGKKGRAERSKRASFYEPSRDALFVTKAICLISQLPMVRAPEACLRTLHRLALGSRESELPLESFVYWLLHQVPLPHLGGTLKVHMGSADVICQRPGLDELPFLDVGLRELFGLVHPDTFLKVFTCVLLEHQVLLCSQSLGRLMLVAESLCGLLLPFRWQHAYVPILPYSQATFLELPLPYIMGLAYKDSIPQQVFQSTVCILDIDSGSLQMPEDVPTFPDKTQLLDQLKNILDKPPSPGSPPEDPNHPPLQKQSEFARLRDGGSAAREALKRLSKSFDGDALEAEGDAASEVHPSDPLSMAVLAESASVSRAMEIARSVGVDISLSSLSLGIERTQAFRASPTSRAYFADMKLNNAVRELFFSRLVHMFYSYSDFVIGNAGLGERDSTTNFDKATFLSDQPESQLPFLAAFIETQMFTTFVDWKIMSTVDPHTEPDSNLVLFDRRLKKMRELYGNSNIPTPTHENSPILVSSDDMIKKRESGMDFMVPDPQPLSVISPNLMPPSPSRQASETFPTLRGEFLGVVPSGGGSPWHRPKVPQKPKEEKLAEEEEDEKQKKARKAAENWKLVAQLLREAKAKTKRLLVEKMGSEAVHLGHTDISITGVEENTLVASFCDLLERIWAHEAKNKQGKSAIWRHLLAHQAELDKAADPSARLHPNALLTPAAQEGRGLGRSESQAALSVCVEEMEVVDDGGWSPFGRRRFHGSASASRLLDPPDDAANNNAEGSRVVDYLKGLQRELHPDSSGNWGSSLLRAASFISSKIGPASTPLDFAPSWSGGELGSEPEPSGGGGGRKRSLSRPRSPDLRNHLRPLPTHIIYDLKNVLRMTEIKTEIGYARAFVRLSLERQLLHQHLKTLTSRDDLIKKLYNRNGFLRYEEEREQFLCHVLTLNAARFRCFTSTFTRTRMEYQVLLVPTSSRFFATSSGSLWIRLAGTLRETPPIHLPPNTLQFSFQHLNLGLLSTLRIGHQGFGHDSQGAQSAGEETGPPPKWFLDHVIARNEVTGLTYKFPCGRWLGRGVDDGAMERLLVAETLDPNAAARPPNDDAQANANLGSRSSTPSGPHNNSSRSRSPSLRRRSDNPRARVALVQAELGDAVNAIFKHFHRHMPAKEERSELTRLLCGEGGLVRSLEKAFLIGLRSSRFFRSQFPWDFVERAAEWHRDLGGAAMGAGPEQRHLVQHLVDLAAALARNAQIGKEEKFRAFVLVALREHVLSGLVSLCALTPVTGSMYDEPSFLRSPAHLTHLTQLLHGLNDFPFALEDSLLPLIHR